MIIGVGTDICRLIRIEQLLKGSKKDHFLSKTYTEEEIENLPKGKNDVSYCAGRWAAKEAISKCLGTGFGAKCRWLDINIRKLPSGAPEVHLSGTTKETADKLGIKNFHLSISHEKEYAIAFAVAES
jgi:holo-[acyl-carrier protein] synthase